MRVCVIKPPLPHWSWHTVMWLGKAIHFPMVTPTMALKRVSDRDQIEMSRAE